MSIGKRPRLFAAEMPKCAKAFVHDCRYDQENAHLVSCQNSVFQVTMERFFHDKHLPDSHTK